MGVIPPSECILNKCRQQRVGEAQGLQLPVWPCGSASREGAQILHKLHENKPKDLLLSNEEGTKICPVGYFAARPPEHLAGLDVLCESRASGVCFFMFVIFFSQGYHSESPFNKALAACLRLSDTYTSASSADCLFFPAH